MSTSLRLHISPLSPDLLPSYLSAQQLALARDISYHEIPTFPEKAFGYVTLPTMEAHKVKKKFNGATLKGSRVRVQEASPEKRKVQEEPADEGGGKKRRKKAKEHGVLPGFELPADRTVKRGWTDPNARPATRSRKEKSKHDDDKPKQQPSKYTNHPELLFRGKAPAAESASKSKTKKRAKVVAHEFENTQQFPAFIKSTPASGQSKISRRFVEGEGWLDEDGNCVEEDRSRPARPPVEPDSEPVEQSTKSKKKSKKDVKKSPQTDEPATPDPPNPRLPTPEAKPKRTSSRKSKPPALELKVPQGDRTPDADVPAEDAPAEDAPESFPTLNPLEALYKRPKDEPAAANEPFTFFGGEKKDEVHEDLPANSSPHAGIQTPKSRAEPRWTRSGAPTPDTAFGRRRFSFSRGVVDVDDKVDEEDEDEDEDEGERDAKPAAEASSDDAASEPDGDEPKDAAPREQTTFEKWFWENRGANNRAWKKRRREALREVRRRDNKRLSRKIV